MPSDALSFSADARALLAKSFVFALVCSASFAALALASATVRFDSSLSFLRGSASFFGASSRLPNNSRTSAMTGGASCASSKTNSTYARPQFRSLRVASAAAAAGCFSRTLSDRKRSKRPRMNMLWPTITGLRRPPQSDSYWSSRQNSP